MGKQTRHIFDTGSERLKKELRLLQFPNPTLKINGLSFLLKSKSQSLICLISNWQWSLLYSIIILLSLICSAYQSIGSLRI